MYIILCKVSKSYTFLFVYKVKMNIVYPVYPYEYSIPIYQFIKKITFCIKLRAKFNIFLNILSSIKFPGISDDREGLLDIIHRNKNNYQKRAYQCIKCLVSLFAKSPVALSMLNSNQQLARQWVLAVEWLQDELDRQQIRGNYNYSSWSPPAQSNDSTNSFILERSLSAKIILSRALKLCPDEVSYHYFYLHSFSIKKYVLPRTPKKYWINLMKFLTMKLGKLVNSQLRSQLFAR